MDKYTLKPDNTNISETLIKDPIGRNDYVAGIIKLLKNLNGNAIITLEGAWGSGKTFLVKQLEMICNDQSCWENFSQKCKQIVEVLPGLNNDSIKVLYYDAWKNDGSSNPLLNLIYNLSIMSGITIESQQFSLNRDELLTQLLNAGKSISPAFEVIDFIRRIVIAEKTTDSEIMNIINNENNINDALKLFIERIKDKNKDKKVVIVIDELDRCRPEFALKLIESVKHYFSEEGIIVILVVNPFEMNSVIKKYYGNDFDAYGYIDKIVDMRIQIPDVPTEEYLNFIFTHYVTNAGIPNVVRTIIKKYKLSMRQINRYVSALKCFLSEDVISGVTIDVMRYMDDNVRYFVDSYLIPYLIGVRIFNIDDYVKLKNGEAGEMFENDYMSGRSNPSIFKMHNIISNEPNKSVETIKEQELEAIRKIYNYGFAQEHNSEEIYKLVQNAIQLTESLNIINLK